MLPRLRCVSQVESVIETDWTADTEPLLTQSHNEDVGDPMRPSGEHAPTFGLTLLRDTESGANAL